MDDARLGRLEVKLDRLAEAMMKLVAHEAVMENLINHNVTQDKRLDSHSARMDDADDERVDLKLEVQKNSSSSRFAERIFFLILTAGVGAVAYSLRG
jgi:hypothetical protein|tara:strand:- start:27 stop:317 length:291 start_codon:yes stop_codon:yes gene_type:complete